MLSRTSTIERKVRILDEGSDRNQIRIKMALFVYLIFCGTNPSIHNEVVERHFCSLNICLYRFHTESYTVF